MTTSKEEFLNGVLDALQDESFKALSNTERVDVLETVSQHVLATLEDTREELILETIRAPATNLPVTGQKE